jgi:DNA-binding response OmpR family regulator
MADAGKILIADDEDTFSASVADLLRKEGYQCDCAPDAFSASKMLQDGNHDLLIADIRMPGNAELEFIHQVPDIAEGLPVIIVTGYPSVDSAVKSLNLPVVAYLVKPFEFQQLLAQVRTSIKNYQMYRTLRSVQNRLNGWRHELTSIEGALSSSPTSASTYPVEAFLNLTFNNIINVMRDIKHITEALTLNNMEQQVCHLFNCPRLQELSQALENTINVLEQTKGSFKSKEIAKLRKTLEELLKKNQTWGAQLN